MFATPVHAAALNSAFARFPSKRSAIALPKVDTWRSKKIVASMELAADTAIPLEALIGKTVATRFRRGIGAANVATYQVRSMVACELPAERTYPLSSDEFQTFCDGENSNARSGMYLCIGLFVSAVVGLFSLFENADWASFWAHQRGMLLVYFAVLLVIAAGSVTGFCICLYRLCKENTAYTRLKSRIDGHFDNVRFLSHI
jgi:hypothetical protein